MRVLIIGGTRFLGVAVAKELASHGHDVTVLHRGQTAGELPDSIHHLLGNAHDPDFIAESLRNGAFDAVIDTILTASDLQRCLPVFRKHAARLIHCGSTGVYAPADRIPTREEDPTPCPPEFGGFAEKLAQDNALLSFHRETDFNVCSLRVSNIIGPGDIPLDIWGARNPAYFQRLADHEEIWIPNDGRALVQPAHVADLARGFRAALESGNAAGKIYNLSSNRAVTLSEYARLAAELLDSRSEFHFVPLEKIIATGKADEGGIRFLCEHMCIDSGKAARQLGYEPRIELDEALRESLAWMKERCLLRT